MSGRARPAPCKSVRWTASSLSRTASCIGCKSCIAACPWGTPQWDPATNKVVKCDYCKDRIDARAAARLRHQVRHRLPVLRRWPTRCPTRAVSATPDSILGRAAGRPGHLGAMNAILAVLPRLARRRRRRRPGRSHAAGSHARRRVAGPGPSAGTDAVAAVAARAGARASWRAAVRANRSRWPGAGCCAAPGPTVLVIDATGLDRRARGTAAVLDRRSAAAGRGGADRRWPARQPRGPAAPPGRAERSRRRPAERGQRDPYARPRHYPPHAAGGAARQPPRPVGGGAARRRLTAQPHP